MPPRKTPRRVPLPTRAPDNLPYRVRLLAQTMSRQFQVVLLPFGITPLHWGVLSYLWQQDGRTAQEIAAALEQLPGTLTIGFNTMEKRKLISRTPDDNDGRVSRIRLTAKGRRLEGKLTPLTEEFVAMMFACLSAKEYQLLAALTQKVTEHLRRSPYARQTP